MYITVTVSNRLIYIGAEYEKNLSTKESTQK